MPSLAPQMQPHILLEPLSAKKHLDDFHAIWSDEETLIWSSRIPHTTLSQSLAWLHQSIPPLNPDTEKYAIILNPQSSSIPSPPPSSSSEELETGKEKGNGKEKEKEKPKMIGIIGVTGKADDFQDGCFELAYTIHKSFWGRGYGSEALGAFVVGREGAFWGLETDSEEITDRKNVQQLVAKIDTENLVSQKMMMRVGASQVQVMRSAYGLGRDKASDGRVPPGKMRDLGCWVIGRPGL